jgi:hypothetical protein
VTSPSLLEALYIAALLSARRDLSYRTRAMVIARALSLGPDSAASIEALYQAFRDSGLVLDRSWRPYRTQADAAKAKAEQWSRRGVYIIPARSIKAPDASRHNLPEVLFARGDPLILDEEAACIVNSRKARRVDPNDPWIPATISLFQLASKRVRTFVSSYGTLSYGLVSTLTQRSPHSLVIVCDGVLPFMEASERVEDFLERHEDLFSPNHTLFLSPYPPGSLPPAPARWKERDGLVVALSSQVFVAAIRKGGTMDEIVRTACTRPIDIVVMQPEKITPTTSGNLRVLNHPSVARIEPISIQTQPHPAEESGDVFRGSVQPKRRDLRLREWPEQGSHLIHYTRSCSCPWPGQTWGAYCKSLIDHREDAAHTGFHTLLHILEEGRIRASHRLTRGAVPVVSFTECLPRELEGIMKWRRGLIRWSFEPYGIGVAKEALLHLGVSRVIYGDEDDFRNVPQDDKCLFQLR